MKCECGMIIGSAYKIHYESVYHNNYKRINALLKSCIPLSEIARRLGTSRETIRQISNKTIKKSGRERQKSCAINNSITKINNTNWMKSLKQWLDVYNLNLEYVYPNYDINKPYSRLFLINNYRCFVRTLTLRIVNQLEYLALEAHKISLNCDFLLLYNKEHNIWLILPKDKAPSGRTMFSLNPIISGANSDRHDYVDYINAFYLLKK